MTWGEFRKAYNFRITDRCCANCEHGAVQYEGECCCRHPLVKNERRTGDMIYWVCDLWEAMKGGAK